MCDGKRRLTYCDARSCAGVLPEEGKGAVINYLHGK